MTIATEDWLAIQELHHRYYLTTDAADVDGFMDCWADDRPVRFESVFGDLGTREELRAFEDGHVSGGMAVGKRHYNVNLVLRPGEDAHTVYATSYMVVIEVADAPHVVATGIYKDSRVVRTAKGWRFQHRRLEVDAGFQKLMAQGSITQAAE